MRSPRPYQGSQAQRLELRLLLEEGLVLLTTKASLAHALSRHIGEDAEYLARMTRHQELCTRALSLLETNDFPHRGGEFFLSREDEAPVVDIQEVMNGRINRLLRAADTQLTDARNFAQALTHFCSVIGFDHGREPQAWRIHNDDGGKGYPLSGDAGILSVDPLRCRIQLRGDGAAPETRKRFERIQFMLEESLYRIQAAIELAMPELLGEVAPATQPGATSSVGMD